MKPYELAREHSVDVALPYTIGFLTDVLREQGEIDAAAALLEEVDVPESPRQNTHLMFFRLARARLRLVTGEVEKALKEAQDIGRTVAAVPSDNPAVIPWRAVASEALRRLDRHDEAIGMATDSLALATLWGADYAIGGALCIVGRVDETTAEERFRDAVAILTNSAARLEYARALVELGAHLRRANRRVEGREYLREGFDLAHELGARALADRANTEIAATGAKPRNQPSTGLDALTASEWRVAQLAAEGCTNKEIAQALFVTVKTVELHLSNTYRKLNITSRGDLSGWLGQPAGAAS